MRKLLLLLGIFLTVLLCFGCKKDNAAKEPFNYVAKDMTTFLADWKQAQTTPIQSDGLNSILSVSQSAVSEPITMTIPILKSEVYSLFQVSVNENYYMYYFVPTGFSDAHFDYKVGITVFVSRRDHTFSAVCEQHNLTPTDGVAYYQAKNTWYLNNDGKRISISFPESVVFQDPGKLEEYFAFEEYTAPIATNDHVTE